ncbi:hypothetical protein AB7Z85_09105 [Pseudenterobacter timonensis]|uniref:Uncharacterized protein n=1 Tax=Pseudenterobacter timonensis TaxID=1755099 RepID=A0ABV4A6V9_9ENTR
MSLSKTKIDKAGAALSKGQTEDIIKFIEFEDVFDEYRKNHLQPLSEPQLNYKISLMITMVTIT